MLSFGTIIATAAWSSGRRRGNDERASLININLPQSGPALQGCTVNVP